jgi:endo-1,4-beta-mannosidase
LGKKNFFIRGVNYYPRHAPWERFLIEGKLDEIAKELDLIADARLNTLRIFLWYEPLFTCTPEEAEPNPEIFAKLDTLISLASERNLHLIVTLNDLPDLHFRPLYTDWAHYDAQTAFIVNRYRDEPAILAWDLRNEADLDYGARDGSGQFERESVLAWLVHTAEIVRAKDVNHLITAGWWGDAAETAAAVDILSFHHWTDAAEMESRIDALREQSSKPILVEEVGYPSWGEGGETFQAETLGQVIDVAQQSQVAGWLIWTAFDFAPTSVQPGSPEYHFGLWRTNLTPKPALDILKAK